MPRAVRIFITRILQYLPMCCMVEAPASSRCKPSKTLTKYSGVSPPEHPYYHPAYPKKKTISFRASSEMRTPIIYDRQSPFPWRVSLFPTQPSLPSMVSSLAHGDSCILSQNPLRAKPCVCVCVCVCVCGFDAPVIWIPLPTHESQAGRLGVIQIVAGLYWLT